MNKSSGKEEKERSFKSNKGINGAEEQTIVSIVLVHTLLVVSNRKRINK